MAKTVGMWCFCALAVGVTIGVGAIPAAAADCAPLKILNTVPMTTGPRGQRLMIKVTINGTPETLLLDTGGAITQLSRDVAKQLNLPIRQSNVKMLDLYGHASRDAASVSTLLIGHMEAHNVRLPIEPNPDFSKGQPWVGLLAPDIFLHYDVDLDPAGLRLNYFSQDHCDGQVIYWKTPAVAVVPMRFDDSKIKVPVTIDGHEFTAVIDTGAPTSLMDAQTAQHIFNVTAASPNAIPLGNFGKDTDKQAFGYIFKNLSFEGVAVNNPRVQIIPDVVGSKDSENDLQTDSHIKRDDDRLDRTPVTLGMDVLKRLHIYMAFGERKLYITPANPQDSAILTAGSSSPTPP